jgi:hypothetical protein
LIHARVYATRLGIARALPLAACVLVSLNLDVRALVRIALGLSMRSQRARFRPERQVAEEIQDNEGADDAWAEGQCSTSIAPARIPIAYRILTSPTPKGRSRIVILKFINRQERAQLRAPLPRPHVVRPARDRRKPPPLPPERLADQRRVFERPPECRIPIPTEARPAARAKSTHVPREIEFVIEIVSGRAGPRDSQRMVNPVEEVETWTRRGSARSTWASCVESPTCTPFPIRASCMSNAERRISAFGRDGAVPREHEVIVRLSGSTGSGYSFGPCCFGAPHTASTISSSRSGR